MLFSTQIPRINNYVTPQYVPQTPKYGNKQIWGDVLGGAQLVGGIALAATGVGLPVAVPLMSSGASTLYNTNKDYMRDGGIVKGGSHESGDDIALVHTQSGADTGIRIEGDELVVSKENTEEIKNAIKKNDLKGLMKVVKKQLKEGGAKIKNGEEEYGQGTDWRGIPTTFNQQQQYPADWITQQQGMAIPTWGGTPNLSAQNPTPPIDFTDVSLWGVPTATETQTAEMQGGQNFGGGNYWSYIPGLAQTAIGLMNTKGDIPTIKEPTSYSNYVNRLAEMSTQGYTPEERALIDRDIKGTYELGLSKAKQYSGGNSAAILSSLNQLGMGMNTAKLTSAAQEAALKRQNLLNYGSALGAEAQMFNLPNQEWAMKYALMNKEAAASLANTGLSNIQSAATYNNLYNSPEYLALIQAYKNKATQ